MVVYHTSMSLVVVWTFINLFGVDNEGHLLFVEDITMSSCLMLLILICIASTVKYSTILPIIIFDVFILT